MIQFPSYYSLTGITLNELHCYLSPGFPLHIIFKTTILSIWYFSLNTFRKYSVCTNTIRYKPKTLSRCK